MMEHEKDNLDFDGDSSVDKQASNSSVEIIQKGKRSSLLPPANPIQQGSRTQQIIVKNPLQENIELPQKAIESLMQPLDHKVLQNNKFLDEAFLLQNMLEKQSVVVYKYKQKDQTFTSLFDYYIHHYKQLVYKRYECQDLNAPVQVGNRRYFASIVYDLKKNVKREFSVPFQSNFPQFDSHIDIPKETVMDVKNIQFDSKFESGNLFCAFEKSPNEFDLVLQNDINSKGHTQWFFFSVKIKKKGVVRFSIVNLTKSGSLFTLGMQPVCFSEATNKRDQLGWFRDGQNITYTKNIIRKEGSFKDKCYYTLSFSINFKNDNDSVLIAHSYPYTFTQLGRYLNGIFENNTKNQHVNRKTLCKTIGGNKCEIITITSASLKQRSMRRGFFLIARQHPGEPQGSYMMEGVIDYLLGDSIEALYIRSAAIIKIVPMVNIDGVVVGNYRCSLAGCDLNRRWKNPKKRIHPEVMKIKDLIKNFTRERQVRLVCDFHGHSRKTAAFFYGCVSAHNNKYLNPRIFPYIMSQMPSFVSFQSSTFGVQPGKETTARVRIYQEMRVPLVYTLEASFYGYSTNKSVQCEQYTHFTIQDYKDIGKQFCLGLYKILYDDVGALDNDELQKLSFSPTRPEEKKSQLINIKEIEQELINQLGDLNKEDKDESVGSDTDVSEDNLDDDFLINIIPSCSLTKKQKKLMEQLKEQTRKDQQALKKSSVIKDPLQKQIIDRPKSLQKDRLQQQYNWIVDRNKKKEEQKDVIVPHKVMVDKAIQTDEKMYKDWLRNCQLEKAKNLIQNSLILSTNQKVIFRYKYQISSDKQQVRSYSNNKVNKYLFHQGKLMIQTPNLSLRVSMLQQQKGFKINANYPNTNDSNFITSKEDAKSTENRLIQLRTQSAARKKVTQENIIQSTHKNNFMINQEHRISQGKQRQDSFSDHNDISFHKQSALMNLTSKQPQNQQQLKYQETIHQRKNLAKTKYKW